MKKIFRRTASFVLSASLSLSAFGITAFAADVTQAEYVDFGSIEGKEDFILYHRDAVDAVAQAMLEHQSSINISKYAVPSADCDALLANVVGLYAESFVLSRTLPFKNYYVNSSGNITTINLNYLYDKSTSDQMLEEFYAEADYYLDKVSEELSCCRDDFSKAAVLHDEIVMDADYSGNNNSNYTMMINKFGVCENYSRVYSYLLSQVGIYSELVDSDSMNHEWNKIKLDGKYYHVDVTWDDSTGALWSNVSHNYYLYSDSAMPDHEGFVTRHNSSDTRYDNAAFHNYGGKFCKIDPDDTYLYAVDNENKYIVRYDYQNKTSSNVVNLTSYKWSAGGSSYWAKGYTGLDQYGGKLYFNTPSKIFSYDVTTKVFETIATNSSSKSYYGMCIQGNKLYANMASSPNETGSKVLVKELEAQAEVQSVSLNKTSASLKVGGSLTLSASVTPSNAVNSTITWKSSNTAVATVSGGTVKAVGAGTAVITASAANGKSASCTVTVTAEQVQPTSISLSKTSVSLETGNTYTLTASILPENATETTVTWSTSNANVAAVSGGKITAVSAGTATITASTSNGKTASCTVTVTDPVIAVSSVSLNYSSVTLSPNGTVTLTATVSPSNATNKTITWKSSNTSVAAVSNGKVTAVAPGTATITAASSNGKTASCTITVKNSSMSVSTSLSISTVNSVSNVDLTANVNGGTSPYTYTFTCRLVDDEEWMLIGDENTSENAVSFIPPYTGSYELNVTAKDKFGQTAEKTVTFDAKGQSTLPVNNSTISAASVPAGTKVTLYGKVSGGISPFGYAYYYKKSTESDWTVIGTEYGSSTSASFVPSSAGTYDILISVCDDCGTTDDKSFTLTVTKPVSTLNNTSTINSDKVQVGDKVRISASANGGTAPYKYAYYYKRSTNASWKVLGTEYGTNSSVAFTPTSAASFDIKVIVKDSKGNTAEKLFTVTALEELELTNVSVISRTNIKLGTAIPMIGKAVGGSSPYTYAFYFKRSTNTNWKLLGEKFTTTASARLKPTATGSYDIKIIVKDSTGKTETKLFIATVN